MESLDAFHSLVADLDYPMFVVTACDGSERAGCLVGFLTQYLPWAPITRVLFIYEMIGGLIFMVLALAFVLGQLAEHWPRWGRRIALAHLGMAVTFFLYFYPMWAAVPISESAWSPGPGTPVWGAKRWFANCNDHPELHPAIFCWY